MDLRLASATCRGVSESGVMAAAGRFRAWGAAVIVVKQNMVKTRRWPEVEVDRERERTSVRDGSMCTIIAVVAARPTQDRGFES